MKYSVAYYNFFLTFILLIVFYCVLQALEAEIHAHEPVINSVNGRAQQMIRSNHYASSDIESKSKELLSRLNHMKDTASVRRLRLLDAMESQMVRMILIFNIERFYYF